MQQMILPPIPPVPNTPEQDVPLVRTAASSPPSLREWIAQAFSSPWPAANGAESARLDTPTVQPSAWPAIENLYLLYQPHEVRSFLARHPELFPVLLDARSWLGNYFPGAQATLEVVRDYDAQTDRTQLVAFIASGLEPDEAVSRLARFFEAWWMRSPAHNLRLLTFALE